MDSVVDLGLFNCGGPCEDGYECVVAGNYSQCIDCSPTGNWPHDCPTYDEAFRESAIATCGMPCDKKPPVPANSQFKQPKQINGKTSDTTLANAEVNCALGPMWPDSNEDQCFPRDDGSVQVMCGKPNPKRC